MPKEHWVAINGYEGWYEVSDLGRVRSIDRIVRFKNGKGSRFYKGKILKFRYHKGYAMVNLNKNKIMKEHYVHRLVIENFTLHPKYKKWVNHKDGRKYNNRLSNLEWCTPKENNDHAIKHNLRNNNNIAGILAANNNKKKQVALIQYGEIVHLESSALDMANYLINMNKLTNVTLDQARYAIRYACQSGRIYQNMRFEYYKAS